MPVPILILPDRGIESSVENRPRVCHRFVLHFANPVCVFTLHYAPFTLVHFKNYDFNLVCLSFHLFHLLFDNISRSISPARVLLSRRIFLQIFTVDDTINTPVLQYNFRIFIDE
jgi:hypothetical protein